MLTSHYKAWQQAKEKKAELEKNKKNPKRKMAIDIFKVFLLTLEFILAAILSCFFYGGGCK